MAQGAAGQIALAKLNSLYANVNTVNLWTNFVSESLEHKFAELEEGAITGSRDAPFSFQGIESIDGDVAIEPYPGPLSHYLRAWFGSAVHSTVTAAASTGANSGTFAGHPQVYHRYTPNQSAFDSRCFLDPYNVMVYRDVGSAWLYKGVIIPTLKFDFTAGQLVKATVSMMGRQGDRIQRTNGISAFVSSGGGPWVWDMTSVEVSTSDTTSAGLAAFTNFEQLSMTLTMPHDGVVFLDGTKRYGEFSPSDFRRVNIEGTMSFRDHLAYEAFKNYTNLRMRLTMMNVNSQYSLGNVASLNAAGFLGYPGLRFHIPNMKFLSWSAPIPGPTRLQAKFTAKAQYDSTAGASIIADLLNNINSVDIETAY